MDGSTALVRYDAMCRAIDAAYSVDEVKDIRDKALAFEAYAKQAKNTEAERRACEIRLRAERKAGQLLSEMEARGERQGRGGDRKSESKSDAATLNDLRISKTQSSRWQQLAGVPEDEFEAALAAPDKPSTAGIIGKKRDPMDPMALWFWGRLRDFERDGFFDTEPSELLAEMTDAMRADVQRIVSPFLSWLEGFVDESR